MYANPSDPPATNKARGRKKENPWIGDCRVQMEKSCFNYCGTSTSIPDKYSRLNVEIEDRLSLPFKTLRTIRAAEITRIVLLFFYNPSFSQSSNWILELNFKETSREINSSHFDPYSSNLFKNFISYKI